MPKLQQLKVQVGSTAGTGKEPTWDNFNETHRQAEVIHAFNFYNYHFDHKTASLLVADYLLQNDRMDEHKKWAKVPAYGVKNAIGWYARMITMGYPATEQEIARVDDSIAYAIANIPEKLATSSAAVAEETANKKANIQEVMLERANYLGGELEYLLDLYIDEGAKAKHKHSPIAIIKIANILPQHIPALVAHWEDTRTEFAQAHAGVIKDFNESYSDYTKIQLRNIVKFTDLVIADLNSYVTFKKSNRAAPKRRIKTPKQQVQKLKYSKEFKELELKSIKPEKILGAKEMFVYSPKKRKLHYYVADEAAGNALMVKNNTIVGFDASKTVMKTIRTPKKQIKEFMKATRPGTRKMFKGIRTVEAKVSGRFAEDLVILKVF